MPCSYGIFQYLIHYFCVDLNMFWYDFELFLNNWYLGSLISFMLVRGSNWNMLNPSFDNDKETKEQTK